MNFMKISLYTRSITSDEEEKRCSNPIFAENPKSKKNSSLPK